MKRCVQATLPLLLLAASAQAVDLRELRGRVIDGKGQPVAGADVSYFWRANGPFWDKQGKPVDLNDAATRKDYWGPAHLGQMEPGVREVAKTDSDGRFQFKIADAYHTLMAMDVRRSRGGLGVVSKSDPSAPIEIRLGPLVRVRGSFEGPAKGVRPAWTHICMRTAFDPTRPLHVTRLVGCGSNQAVFLMSLPPGRYFIEAQNEGASAQIYLEPIVLSGDSPEVDLGVLFLKPSDTVIAKRKRSQSQGTWGDYTKHYGRNPPAWHVTDARGVSKDVQISDFKGKWVLLDFWGLSCTPCLSKTIPALLKFYDEHKGQRDRFEIVSICIDPDGELNSLEDLDRALRPIVTEVWGGRTIPFPILLDNTFKTWESFGLLGLNTVLLIDPEGNLVEGDLAVLEQKIEQ